jgi:beta-mannosidase
MRTSLTPFTGFPAVSWSLVDADYRKKLAWYAVKRAYAPITIGAERFVEVKLKPGANKHTAIDISKTTGLRVWTSNLTLRPIEAVLHLRMFKVGGGESVYESKTKIILEPNRSQEVMKYLPMPVGGTQSSDEVHETVAAHTVVALLLRSLEGEVLARFVEWPQPLRHLDLLPDGVDVIVKPGKHDVQRIVTLRASRPIKAFELFARDADLELSDNCIDLVPDEERTIVVGGCEHSEILHQHLGCFGH